MNPDTVAAIFRRNMIALVTEAEARRLRRADPVSVLRDRPDRVDSEGQNGDAAA